MKDPSEMTPEELLAERDRLNATIARQHEAELNWRDRQLGIPADKPTVENKPPEPMTFTRAQIARGEFDIELVKSGRAIVTD